MALAQHIEVRLLWPKLLNLLLSGGYSCIYPFFGIFYDSRGLTKVEIGVLGALSPLFSSLGAPLLTYIADSRRCHLVMVTVTLSLSATLNVLQLVPREFVGFAVLVCAASFMGSPVGSIVDSATLSLLGDRKDDYGKQRLWGAVGWGTMAFVVGALIDALGIGAAFVTYGAFTVASVIALALVPMPFGASPAKRKHSTVPEGAEDEVRASGDEGGDRLEASELSLFEETRPRGQQQTVHQADVHDKPASGKSRTRAGASDVLRLFTSFDRAVFFAVMVFVGVFSAAISGFLFIHLRALGANDTLMGLSLAITCAAEIPVFFYAQRILALLSVPACLCVVLAAFALRMACYTLLSSPWWVLPVESLHGITFGLMWAAAVSNADAIAPEGLKGTSQGVLNGAYSLGQALGSVAAGAVYQRLGAVAMYRMASATAACALVTFMASVVWSRGACAKGRRGYAYERVGQDDREDDQGGKDLGECLGGSAEGMRLEVIAAAAVDDAISPALRSESRKDEGFASGSEESLATFA